MELEKSVVQDGLSVLQRPDSFGRFVSVILKGAGAVPPPGAGGFSGMQSDGGLTTFRFNPRNADDIFSEFFGFSSPFGGMGDMGGSRAGPKGHFSRSMFGDDIFSQFRGGGGGGGEGSASMLPRKGAAIERQLPCSLENLYKGTTKKMKLSRDATDATGRPTTVEEILTIEIKPGWKKGTKITFPEKGNEQRGVIPSDLVFIIDKTTLLSPHIWSLCLPGSANKPKNRISVSNLYDPCGARGLC